ncbi:hypothetical protein [Nakamurella lactea]|uniref:hypothetical protein n=1 Tax=Nakamurella lactea TaxID=459515 RepID=UPI00048E3093|nr:hypothetical protein [Nakamurella lactea]
MVTSRPAIAPAAARRRLWLAGALALLSLGLPWSAARAGYQVAGWYAPGSCISVYDADGYATLDCSPGYYSPGWSVAGQAAAPGYATDLRIVLAVALTLLVLGLRRDSGRLQLAGLIVAVAGFALNPGEQPGQLAYAGAVVVLASALLSSGRGQLRSAASTSPATSRIRSSSSAP